MLRKRLMKVLLVGALVLAPGISAFAAIDESQESEKLYMIGIKKRDYIRQMKTCER